MLVETGALLLHCTALLAFTSFIMMEFGFVLAMSSAKRGQHTTAAPRETSHDSIIISLHALCESY